MESVTGGNRFEKDLIIINIIKGTTPARIKIVI